MFHICILYVRTYVCIHTHVHVLYTYLCISICIYVYTYSLYICVNIRLEIDRFASPNMNQFQAKCESISSQMLSFIVSSILLIVFYANENE